MGRIGKRKWVMELLLQGLRTEQISWRTQSQCCLLFKTDRQKNVIFALQERLQSTQGDPNAQHSLGVRMNKERGLLTRFPGNEDGCRRKSGRRRPMGLRQRRLVAGEAWQRAWLWWKLAQEASGRQAGLLNGRQADD